MKNVLQIFSIIFLLTGSGCKKSINYAGLRVLYLFDESRKFDTTGKAKTTARPVRIDLFYPSTNALGATDLTYGDILDLYARRMDYSVSIDSAKKSSSDLARAIAQYFKIDSRKILKYPTGIYQDLKLDNSKYPLIIYASSMNGGSWENPLRFKELTENGYIVAVVNSVGKFPGFMSEAIDMEEQVKDILFVKDKMKKMPYVDNEKIGLLSWSLGGTSAATAATLSPDFKCLLSYDGTEIHYYGFDKEWDKQYNLMAADQTRIAGKFNIPYLYLSSSHGSKFDSVYHFPSLIRSRHKFFLQFNNSIHEDFSSLPKIKANLSLNKEKVANIKEKAISALTLTFFSQYLKGESEAGFGDSVKQLVKKNPAMFSINKE